MKRRQGDRWARAVLNGSCGLQRRTGEPYMPLEEEHDGRYQMRDSRCVRRELRLCCTGRESPSCSWKRGAVWRVGWRAPTVTEGSLQLCCTGRERPFHRRVRSITPMDRRGLTLRLKGAEALPHQKGEPRPTLIGKDIWGAVWRSDGRGSHAPKGACCSAAPGGRASSAARVCSVTQTTDDGSPCERKEPVCLLHRKGADRTQLRNSKTDATVGWGSPSTPPEGRPVWSAAHRKGRPCRWLMLNKQRDATDGGNSHFVLRELAALHARGESPPCGWIWGVVWCLGWRAPTASEGGQRLCCTGSESPVRHRVRSATRSDRQRGHTATEGSRGPAAPEGRALTDAE